MYQKHNAKKWENFFRDRGVSEEIIPNYLRYIRKLNKNNVPVIFEFSHLAKLLGIKESVLATMINASSSFYRSFSIPKRKGGTREISAPYPSLLLSQRWIYHNILLSQKIHIAAHGFAPNRSIISHANNHLSTKCLLKMDLKNFFPSIEINWIINFFNQLGYAKNVSFYLASLCCFEGALGQGAPTSPYLTNILLYSLDNRLLKLSNSYELKYSRYADDLAFSGNYISHRFIHVVANIVEDYGLQINNSKTALHTKPGQRILTGLSVSGEKLTLPRKTKRELRKEIYYITKYGYASHISKKKEKNPFYIDSLQGKFSFWKQVEPENHFVNESLNTIRKVIQMAS
jgi:RNA-directed DNA polymerase